MKYYRWMNDGMVEFEHHPDICSVGLYVTHEACQNAVEERAQESRSFQRRYYEAMDILHERSHRLDEAQKQLTGYKDQHRRDREYIGRLQKELGLDKAQVVT